jgi:hypothetical protein
VGSNKLMENQEFILIGMPCGSGSVPAPMVQSLLQLHKPLPCAFMIVERQMIDTARNGIVLETLQKGASYLLFLDDDNPVPPDTLEKMIEDDKDIVIAPILSRNADKNGERKLCAFYSMEIDGNRVYENIKSFNGEGPLYKIDGGGTGCMLVKVEVLKKLYEIHHGHLFERTRDIFKKPITFNGKEFTERTMSEDVLFCERAIDEGFEVWLDSRIRPLHITGNQFTQWQPGQ